MGQVLRAVLGLVAGGAIVLALGAIARRRGHRSGPADVRLLAPRRPAAVGKLEAAVRRELARTAREPTAIHVSIEHGCVDLRGPVDTRERGRIVRAVAAIAGVDSVVDLMTESAPDEQHAAF